MTSGFSACKLKYLVCDFLINMSARLSISNPDTKKLVQFLG